MFCSGVQEFGRLDPQIKQKAKRSKARKQIKDLRCQQAGPKLAAAFKALWTHL